MPASPRFALRVAPDVREQWEEAAEAEGLTLAKWLHAAAADRLAARSTVDQPATPEPPAVDPDDCPHSRTRSTGYMVMCESCGKRVR